MSIVQCANDFNSQMRSTLHSICFRREKFTPHGTTQHHLFNFENLQRALRITGYVRDSPEYPFNHNSRLYGEYRQLTGRTPAPATLDAIRMLGFDPCFCHALCIWIFDFWILLLMRTILCIFGFLIFKSRSSMINKDLRFCMHGCSRQLDYHGILLYPSN